MFYNFSALHCLPQAMGFPGSAQTGTVFRPSTVLDYAEAAGFSSVDILTSRTRSSAFIDSTRDSYIFRMEQYV